MGHGLGPMAVGHGHGGTWHTIASAHGNCPWPVAMAAIGQKAVAMAVAKAMFDAQRAWQMATATGQNGIAITHD